MRWAGYDGGSWAANGLLRAVNSIDEPAIYEITGGRRLGVNDHVTNLTPEEVQGVVAAATFNSTDNRQVELG